MQLDLIAAKRAIRYLKRGVCSHDAIAHLTAGRERETKHIADALVEVQDGASRHVFIEASYGVGKSHMLKVAESLALQAGFAVSWVTINGADHAFNHPTRYLHSLLENVRVPQQSARGLVALCTHWLANSERDSLIAWSSRHAPWQFSYPINRLRGGGTEVDSGNSDWFHSILEGRDLQHKSGRSHFSEFFSRLEATVGLCRAVGLKGVVFLFDELECIATQLTRINSRLLSYHVLNTMVDARRLPNSMFVFAATEDLGTKIRADVACYGMYETEYPDGYRFAKKWYARDLDLLPIRPVSKADNGRLLRRLRDTHALAYAWAAGSRVDDAFVDDYIEHATKSGWSQRETVKWFVELLEIAQQHPTFVPALRLDET